MLGIGALSEEECGMKDALRETGKGKYLPLGIQQGTKRINVLRKINPKRAQTSINKARS